jgi:hypothetical protein
MHGHKSYRNLGLFEEAFKFTAAQIREKGTRWDIGNQFNTMIDSIYKENSFKIIEEYDEKIINSNFLIENIEYAFMAWQKIPEHHRCNKYLFNNYILPYKSNNEPIEIGLRRHIFNEFNWVYDRLRNNSLEECVCDILDSIDIRVWG